MSPLSPFGGGAAGGPLTRDEIRRLRGLRDRQEREAVGLFAIEGAKIVSDLLAAGFTFTDILGTAAWKGPVTRVVTDADMARASHFPTPSPVLAVGRIQRPALEPGALDRGLTLALDAVQDPGNVGTLLRIADWFAIDRVLLGRECADRFSQKVIQASMGSFARVRTHGVDLPAALASARVPVLGCDLDGEDIHATAPLADAIIVIGNEGHGLSEGVRALVTRKVTIPRLGGAESLNAAVAGALVCDNLRRVRPA